MKIDLKIIHFFISFLTLSITISIPSISQAQDSSKTTKIVVPFVPGGSTDILGRIIAEKLSTSLKQPVIVENRPGAGGTVGSQFVAKSTPDGSTLLLTSVTTAAIAYTLYPNLQYDSKKDFEPVAVIGSIPLVLLVSNKLPIKTLDDLITYAKNNPGKLTFGSARLLSGQGSAPPDQRSRYLGPIPAPFPNRAARLQPHHAAGAECRVPKAPPHCAAPGATRR
jgi:tripartite-type tricarboxylate transporter receptor subunit TctC